MIDNSDLNALLKEATKVKPFETVIQDLKGYLERVVVPLEETEHKETNTRYAGTSRFIPKVTSAHIGYEKKEVFSPYACIGVKRYLYVYHFSDSVIANIVGQYIQSTEPLLQWESLEFNSVELSWLAFEVRERLLDSPDLHPYDLDRMARRIIRILGQSKGVRKMTRAITTHPANVKVTFFKWIVNSLSNLIKVFSK